MTLAPEAEARRLLRARRFGVLSTQSKRLPGYPFGSVVPYMVAHDATLVILISRLAEHTRNVAESPKVSLTVVELGGADVQAESRITVVGDCVRAGADDAMADRYLRLFPNAAEYLRLDFDFHRITPVAVRFIGGFGAVRWINRDLIVASEEIARAELALIEQVNLEHGPDLKAHCAQTNGRVPESVQVAGMDCDGMDIRADGLLVRLDFPAQQSQAATVLGAVAACLRSKAR
jgi:putative heme iron utilization protein